MKKLKMGPQPMLWAHPTVLVGADVDGKPDFATVAWTGVVASTPPAVSIALQHPRYSLKGIRHNLTFSVNIPSRELVRETDYCGLISGAKTDKVKDCKFKVFYGKTPNAPLIEQCPINLECEVRHILNMGSHALVIGEVVETHVSEDCLTEGKPDVSKVKPFAFLPGKYHAIGEAFADAFSIGREIKEV
ncbi:MAG: flavin reductase family protein [Chloroflexi bacterium]|jgi:flavin reductase (DIM6/NTAB) family NADH-FMN oxidoreductase RutF|nr:flavin reductase family protein [Chloroflexota bacterium]